MWVLETCWVSSTLLVLKYKNERDSAIDDSPSLLLPYRLEAIHNGDSMLLETELRGHST
jgi:hypothetical protein